MQALQSRIKLSISYLIGLVNDNPRQYYLNPNNMFIIMLLQRTSLVYLQTQLPHIRHQDVLFEFIQYILHSSTGQLLLVSLNHAIVSTIYHIVGIIHCLVLLSQCFNIELDGIKAILRHYYTYLQICIFIPSILLIKQYHMGGGEIYFICIYSVALLSNYLISYYCLRNYALIGPSYQDLIQLNTNTTSGSINTPKQTISHTNPYIKRYKGYNIILILSDILLAIAVLFLDQSYLNYIMLIQGIILHIDSTFNKPYIYSVNSIYSHITTIILLITISNFMQAVFGFQYTGYYIILIAPILLKLNSNIIQLQQYQLIKNQSQYQDNLIIIIELLHSTQPNWVQKSIIIQNITKKQVQIQQEEIAISLFQTCLQEQYKINKTDEQIYLYYTNYLSKQSKSQLIGYITLKSLQYSHDCSMYYEVYLEEYTQSIIQQYNQAEEKDIDNKFVLNISQVYQSQLFGDECLRLVKGFILVKIQFWSDLLKGYELIEQFAYSARNVGEQILKISDFAANQMNINSLMSLKYHNQYDVLKLKTLSLIYSVVLGDYELCRRMEEQIDTIISYERNLRTDQLINTTVMDDQIVLLQTSMIKNSSCLINTNRCCMAKFFGLNQDDFGPTTYIEQLMPDYVATKHKDFITQFMERGTSKLFNSTTQVFYRYQNDFIAPAQLSLTNLFQVTDDYIMIGALQKQKQDNQYLLFNKLGKLLGISKELFTKLTSEENCNAAMIIEKCYVYFWFQQAWQTGMDKLLSQKGQIEPIESKCIVQAIVNIEQTIRSYLQDMGSDQFVSNSILKHTHNTIMIENCKASTYFELLNKMTKFQRGLTYSVKYMFYSTNVHNQDVYVLKVLEMQQLQSLEQELMNLQEDPILPFNVLEYKQELSDDFNKSECSYISKDNVLENSSQSMKLQLFSQRSKPDLEILIDEQYYMDGSISSPINSNIQQSKLNQKSKIKKQEVLLQGSTTKVKSIKTQKSMINIIMQLQFRKSYLPEIKLIIIFSIALILVLVLLKILQLILMEQNTKSQSLVLSIASIPNDFNFLYCGFLALGQYDISRKVMNTTGFGDYYNYRIQLQSKIFRQEIQSVLKSQLNEVSNLDGHLQRSTYLVRLINEFILIEKEIQVLQFNQLVDSHTNNMNLNIQTREITKQELAKQIVELLFMKFNINSQLLMMSQQIDAIESQFFQERDNFQSIYIIFLISELTTITLILLISFQLWKASLLMQQKILQIITLLETEDIQKTLASHQLQRDALFLNDNRWKQINYFTLICNNNISENNQHKINRNDMNNMNTKNQIKQRIREPAFSTLSIQRFLIVIWSFITIHVIGQYLYQNDVSKSSISEFTLCLSFVKFITHYDCLMILIYLIKSDQQLIESVIDQNLLENNEQLAHFGIAYNTYYNETLLQFTQNLEYINSAYPDIYPNIVSSKKITNDQKSLLMDLYEGDLCLRLKSQFPFCELNNNGKFSNFPDYPKPDNNSNNIESIKYGINGFYQEVSQIISTHFIQEQAGELGNPKQNQNFIDSSQFNRVVFSYFFDLTKAMKLFYQTILRSSIDILESDSTSILIYYIVSSFTVSGIVLAIIFWKVSQQQKSVEILSQCLMLLPFENLLEPQTQYAIKNL